MSLPLTGLVCLVWGAVHAAVHCLHWAGGILPILNIYWSHKKLVKCKIAWRKLSKFQLPLCANREKFAVTTWGGRTTTRCCHHRRHRRRSAHLSALRVWVNVCTLASRISSICHTMSTCPRRSLSPSGRAATIGILLSGSRLIYVSHHGTCATYCSKYELDARQRTLMRQLSCYLAKKREIKRKTFNKSSGTGKGMK